MKCGISLGKKRKRWIWLAISRTTKKILGFAVGSREKTTGRHLQEKIKDQECDTYFTDYWEAYSDFIPSNKHIMSKKETYTIEGYNSLFRHYVARFNRKTKCYSKSDEMIVCTLNLFINKINYT